MKEKQEQIRKIIETILEKMGFSAFVESIESSEGVIFNIKTSEASFLIGEDGAHLVSLNHVVKKMTGFLIQDGEPFEFFLDVNDYQKQKNESLKDLARMTAQKVRYFKKEVLLEPMSSYERRIIHTALAEYPDVLTESKGEGIERRVVVKPRA